MNDQGKTIAIISYITIIGWVIALILRQNENPKTEFAKFHLRQSLGINLLGLASSFITYTFGMLHLGIIANIVAFAIFVLWLIGLIAAIQGHFKAVPFLGQWFQDNFGFVR